VDIFDCTIWREHILKILRELFFWKFGGNSFLDNLAGIPFVPQKEGEVYKRGPKLPPLPLGNGGSRNFKIPKILTEFSFGIGMVNTKKIPKGSYRNTESITPRNYNATMDDHVVISQLHILWYQPISATSLMRIMKQGQTEIQ
jgi:hypothetical protein